MDYEQSSGAEWAIPSTSRAKAVPPPSQHKLTSENLSRVGAAEKKASLVPPNAVRPLATVEVPKVPQSHPGRKNGLKSGNNSTYSSPAYGGAKSRPIRSRKAPYNSKPDSEFELPEVYGRYRIRLIPQATSFLNLDLKGFDGDVTVFREISHRSKTYVKKPENSQKTIAIWGGPHSVKTARNLLSSLIERCAAVATPDASPATQPYAQMQANAARPQNTSTPHDHLTCILRRPPNAGSDAIPNHQMVFLWPVNETPIRKVLGAELEELDYLRRQYKCFIYLSEESEDVLCVSGSVQETLQQAITDLENKWHELVASSKIKSRLYLIDLPVGDRTVRSISMSTSDKWIKPCFHMDSPSGNDTGLWYEVQRSPNDSRLLSAVKRSLGCAPFIQGALTMHVSFGSFMFTQYYKPRDQEKGYTTGEFQDMISNPMAKGQLLPGLEIDLELLMRRISHARHLFDLEESSTVSLSGNFLHHMVSVEFDAINNEFLQLEVDFKAVGGRHERTKSRWIQSQVKGEFAENRPLLQAIMLGVQKADWQFEMRERKILSRQQKSLAMSEFDYQVRFRDGVMQESLLAEPQRRAMLPDGFPVRRLVEKAAIQYPIKGTEYVLEIARYDTYVKKSGFGKSNMNFEPPSSSWGATVYGVNWDENLAKLAGKKEVQEMGFKSVLDPFFSPKINDGSKAGFQGFVDVVKEVAWVLGHNEEVQQRSLLDDDLPQIPLAQMSLL